MNRLEINLASHPFKNNIMYYAFHGFFIVLLVLATSFNIYYFIHYRSLRSEMKAILASSQQEMADLDARAQRIRAIISRKDIKDISDKSLFANDAILMRKFFWTDLFNNLEAVLPYSVKMQSIRPMFTDRGIEVRVDGNAQDLKSFFEFEKNLQTNANFANIRPEKYRMFEGSGLSFSIVFEYRQESLKDEGIFDDKAEFSHGTIGEGTGMHEEPSEGEIPGEEQAPVTETPGSEEGE